MTFFEILDLGWHQVASRLMILKSLVNSLILMYTLPLFNWARNLTFLAIYDLWWPLVTSKLVFYRYRQERPFTPLAKWRFTTAKNFTSQISRKWLPKVHLSLSDLWKVNFCFPRYAYLQVIFSIAELIGGFGLIFQINDQKPIFNSSKI